MRRHIAAGAMATLSGVFLCTAPATAQLQVIDFEKFAEGHRLKSGNFGPGVTLTVSNGNPNHPDAAIIFDSACPGGCSGGDGDLITPGFGPGNDTAQGKVAIIAENVVDKNNDGKVDDPDDELAGGDITLTFDSPRKLKSVRVIDIENFSGPGSFARLTLVGGGTTTVPFPGLGNNSAQTIDLSQTGPATSVTFHFYCTGAIDDIVMERACGDGILDAGEECDPPACRGGDPWCSYDCTIEGVVCGNGILELGEECDPPASQGGEATCNDDCATSVCGDGELGAGEDCDPPASQGGTVTCNDDCSTSVCGDGVLGAGEECDPPASLGGDPSCDDNCFEDGSGPGEGVCGDSVIDSGEECDPPASQGGDADCSDDCSIAVCGDFQIGAGEECDPPASQGGDANCTDTCQAAQCGNEIVEPGEECDPPASQGGDPSCSDDCISTTCGDGIVEGSEECDPPAGQGGDASCGEDCTLGDPCRSGELQEGDPCEIVAGSDDEICNNMEDDDDDHMIDCADDGCLPDEINPEGGPLFCDNGVCTLSPCLPILRDPAIIQFPKFPGGQAFFSMHGRVSAEFGSFNPETIDFTVILANLQGKFLQETLPAGSVKRIDRAGKRLRYKNEAARSTGGVYKASMRFRRVFGFPSYTIKLRIFGDFSGALPPSPDLIAAYSEISILWYGVGAEGEVGYNRSFWKRTRRGWILRLANYLE